MNDEYNNLMDDVASYADDQSARVISNAFLLASVSCPKCNYPQCAEYFEECLEEYGYLQIELYRERKLYRNDYHYMRGVEGWNSILRSEFNIEQDIQIVKASMSNIKPCSDCIKKYNPTRKTKSYMGNPMYGNATEPEMEGFLDYE